MDLADYGAKFGSPPIFVSLIEWAITSLLNEVGESRWLRTESYRCACGLCAGFLPPVVAFFRTLTSKSIGNFFGG